MVTTDGNELLQLSGLTYHYPHEPLVLDKVDLSLHKGERVGLEGPIGSGKTTLLHLIVGLLKPQNGIVRVFGRPRVTERDFWEVRERVGLLFQDPDDQLFCPTVAEDVAFGPLNQGKTREQAQQLVSDTLEVLGLAGYEKRVTHHLSGGEKRLVSVASVLAMQPDILLLDEPIEGLDPDTRDRFTKVLLSLPQTMLVVSHHHSFLDRVTTRRLRLNGACITEA
jgi:cobalt/nickel transport system ATP-binding protein